MAQVLIRQLNAATVSRPKARAMRHGRSLEEGLRAILEQASMRSTLDARALARRIRRRLVGRKHSDSAELLADDRGR